MALINTFFLAIRPTIFSNSMQLIGLKVSLKMKIQFTASTTQCND